MVSWEEKLLCDKMDDSKINLDNIFALLDLAESDPENDEKGSSSQGSPKVLRSGTTGSIIKTFGDAKHFLKKLLPSDSSKKEGDENNDDTTDKSVATVINSLVKVLSRMYKTVTTHGKQIKEVIEQLASEKTSREILL